MPRLIDAHTHVQFAAYDNDWKEVIDRSLAQSTWLVNVGTQKDTSAKAVEIAEKYNEGVYATIGLHPIHTEKSFHDAEELGDDKVAKEFSSRG
ncbi:MAG: TatD family hydrolase, partial [Candidatus Yanofskybacteria bacterium]|nr:TatD family hydrolase [Candidatus Yanofskybacteria bacterium]